jgi:hypothetical protein
MSTITKVKTGKACLLEPDDVRQITRREELKLELCKLNAYLKPRIEACVHKFGTGRIMVGSEMVDLSEAVRATTSWKAVAYAVASEAEVEAVKSNFTLESTSYSARIVS